MSEPLRQTELSTDPPRTVPTEWRRSARLDDSVVIALLLATIGTITSRVEVVLLALPFILSAAWAIDRRPRRTETSGLDVEVQRVQSAVDAHYFAYRVAIGTDSVTELVHLRVAEEGSAPYVLLASPRATGMVAGTVPIAHTGRVRVVEVAYRLIGTDGAWISLPMAPVVVERVVMPSIKPLGEIALPRRLAGLTGTHTSARPGDGGEFRDLHPYAPGDRLRRIDWKATARRSQGFGDLYVRRTDATADATVMLVLDSRDDVGEVVEAWSPSFRGESGVTAMDLTREAAASIAAAAVGAGDRVGLIDLAAHDGVVAAGFGKRHLNRLLRRVAECTPHGVRFSRRRAPIVPAGAIVYALSTFLDDEVTEMALRWRVSGHRVIAVDVLPTPDLEGCPSRALTAHRLLMVERRHRLSMLENHGIERLRWQEDPANPSRAIVMHSLVRATRRRA
ncbi:DUF58 domain-containing protein [Gemmatimonas sp.]|uniref:DUF58 domain-containing protein n=1 Tax=Gemmatimonas sp. TaxID=1962908 RepID=UPI003DA26318